MPRKLVLALAALATACSSNNGTFDGVPAGAKLSGTGVSADVNVLYDSLGIPHIYASSDADAAFALGYAHARDRLFQMDFQRKAARGRFAEYVGAAASSTDVLLRTMFTSRTAASNGSHHVEDLIADGLSPELRTVLERYRDGVNAYISDAAALRNGAIFPPQYLVLGLLPSDVAPWEIEDTIAIGRLLTFQLSETTEAELTLGALAIGMGIANGTATLPDQALFVDLTRHAPAVPAVTLSAPGSALRARSASPALSTARAPLGLSHLAAAQASIAGARRFLQDVHLPLARAERAGSNNWTIAPSLTKNGHALVANDPHLSLSDPSVWHLGHVVTPTRNVAGVAFPGAPVFEIGHNDRIGWGDTVAEYDVTDLYTETLDATLQNVTFNGQQVPIQTFTEHHNVRFVGDQPYPVLLVPHHGPILPGSVAGQTAISVRWTGQDPTFELQAFLDLNKAKSVDEAFTALKSFGVGAQNFNIADVDGHIGYDPHALVPIRNPGRLGQLGCIPWLPLDGSGSCEWTGFIADADLPQAKDPAAGFIATANNDITGALLDNNPLGPDPLGSTSRPYLYAFTDPGFREQRIQNVLRSSTQLTLDSMTSLQADNHSELAATMLPGLLALLNPQRATLTAGGQAALDLLNGWDLSTPTGLDASGAPQAGATNAAASSVFHAFQKRFAQLVLARVTAFPNQTTGASFALGDFATEQLLKIPVALVSPPAPPLPPLTSGAAVLCGAADCSAQAKTALEQTVTFLQSKLGADPSTWLWGRLHQVRFDSAALGSALSFGPFPNDGGLFTVDVANFDPFATTAGNADATTNDAFPYVQHSGPSVRFSAEMDPAGVKWRAVIAGGESDRPPLVGFPGDPHYEDQVPAWLANQPGDQPFAQADVVKAAKSRIVISR